MKAWQQAINTEDMPSALKEYIAFIEDYLNLKIKLVSVGPDREQNILL
jgi:adenylosuccinate synthase